MPYALFIGLRYLRAKRSEGFISLITGIATAGVAIGVMTLNVVLAVMTGFEEDLRDRILAFTPHVLVSSHGAPLPNDPEVAARIRRVAGVVAASPYVQGQAMLASADNFAGVMVRGVEPVAGGVIDFARHVRDGSIEDLATRHTVPRDASGALVELPGIILGKELARQLGVRPGEPVSLVSPVGVPTVVGLVPKVKRFAVTGLFNAGMIEYDSSLAFINLPDAQRFFDLGSSITGVEVRGADFDDADRVAAGVAAELTFPYRVRDWKEMNHNLFSAISLEKTVYFIVLLLIVLVAAFNIVATLIMVVMEKRRDIAILKSMGATRGGIAQIFIYKGLVIGGVGTVVGSLAGYALCAVLRRFEFVELPKDVFYVNTLPVKIYPEYFALVLGVSLAIVLIATLYPARQAARLVPVDALRYD
ncbi:MAG: lipoprotein-releasing ABC transporter permease subunit [Candidatus Binatia bacterium]